MWRLAISSATDQKKRPLLRPDTLSASIAILLVVSVVQRTIGFGRGVLFCRWLDVESLGYWEMTYSFLLLAAPLAVLGLPGSFGRYLVRYREQGQLAMFLRRTTSWTAALAATAIGLIVIFRSQFAYLVFGDAEQGGLLLLVAGCLAAVIVHHFLEAVFAGLQLFRVVSAMHFCQSMVFATTALSLLVGWQTSVESVIVGYAAGCVVSAAGVLIWAVGLGGVAGTEQTDGLATQSHREFWPPLMRFAVGVWIANLLCNLFAIIDRYMILHCGLFDSTTARELIGNYHTSCIVPLLLVSVANLVVGAMTPHLSHDWEQGCRERVAERLNRALQLAAVAMLACGVGVLWFCPWLFQLAFANKYASGLAVLPWTVASCVLFALLLIAQTYAWCAERTRSAAWPLAIGLVVNVALNFAWLPVWGLTGAVAATAVATLTALVAQLAVNQRLGMNLPATTIGVCVCPLLLAGGATVALIGAVTLGSAFATAWLLNRRGPVPQMT